jgi:hypothetical protein
MATNSAAAQDRQRLFRMRTVAECIAEIERGARLIADTTKVWTTVPPFPAIAQIEIALSGLRRLASELRSLVVTHRSSGIERAGP